MNKTSHASSYVSRSIGLFVLCTSCTSEHGDRIIQIQLPLFLFVVLSPIVMIFMRNRRKVLAWMLAAMWFAYVIYETGISMGSNIRVDLVIILPALALGSILSFWWLTRD